LDIKEGAAVMIETTAILRTLLYQAMMAKEENKDIDSVINAIAVLCTKDDIAAVKEKVAENTGRA
jgi:hypothetical protein